MNATSIARAMAALGIAAPLVTWAAVPPVDSVGKPAVIRCGVGPTGAVVNAFHADKIVFRIIGPLLAQLPQDQAALDQIPRDTGLDIKVIDNPRTVADLRGKVLSFLGAVDKPEFRANLDILEVKYAMVCPTTTGP